ncbi:nucleoside-diphosphate kinase [Candidatus Woesearchaeota archaeon]|nr:nucleoside-diphosphate kinase [Candidatus Woesearchaeota archaeon]
MEEKALVLIKPDAMVKNLAGNIISELYNLDLKMIGLKLVNVQKELAEQHYEEHKDKPFFEKLVKHITGELHNNENVIAIAYQGENAVQKIRDAAGKTHPEQAEFNSIRGKYGRLHSETDCFENVMHASDSPENAEKEISLWFDEKELVQF